MGKTAVCTGCQKTFRIGQVRLPFEWKQKDLGEDSWIGVEAPKEKKELKNCIICQAPLPDGSISCPECGANQVTGIARRPAPKAADVKPPVWSMLPMRLIVAAAVLLVIGGGAYWSCRYLSRSAVESGEQAAWRGVVMQATEHLARGEDESSLAAEFGGRVNDENLPVFIGMLSAGRQDVRRAAGLLIGCGDITRIRLVLDLLENDATREAGRATLEAVGNRRLVRLSNHEDQSVRQAAAEALQILCDLKPDQKQLSQLAERMTDAAKIDRLNGMCRPWPEATGRFSVFIAEQSSPFVVGVEQIGTCFYLRMQSAEFKSSYGRERLFEIPLDRWCAATGTAVDASAVRRILGGTVTLASPLGAAWSGVIRLTVRGNVQPPLPGFLPVEPPPAGQTVEVPVYLKRVP
jgi:hypothetical protein